MPEKTEICEKVRITPAMVKAGASVIYGMTLDFASEESYAKRIFKAMWDARPQSAR